MAYPQLDTSEVAQTDPETERIRKLWIRVYERAVEDACSSDLEDPWGQKWARWFLTSGCYDFRQLCHRLGYDADEHIASHRERWGIADDNLRIAGAVWLESDKEHAIAKRVRARGEKQGKKLRMRCTVENVPDQSNPANVTTSTKD